MGKRLLGGLAAIALVLMSFGAASALAAASPVAVAGGTQPGYLSVAVDSGGNAIAAWADKSNPGNDVVRWCVLPAGGGACSGGGSLAPADGLAGFTYVYGTQVLVEGQTIVLLADVEVASTEYESIQEWQSTNGGQSFAPVNGGKAVASGNTSADTQALSAVTLPGGNNLGFGFDTSAEEPTFHAFSLTAPTLCGRATTPTRNCADGYAKLAPTTDADQVGNAPGNFVANDDGVIGVFRTNTSTGNLGCPGASPFGMAFVFGDGLQSPSNNYNVSPGSPNTAWRNPVTLADCGVDYIAAGGGPSGFGVLEDNQLTGRTQYHHFDGTNNTFDTTPAVVSATGEQQPAVSQDSAGGVYATYLSGGIGGPVSLSYSSDGGSTWTGPGTLSADPLGGIAGLTSSVNPSGKGWAVWTENGSVFAQPFTAADAKPSSSGAPPAAGSPGSTTLTTKQKAGSQTGASITVPAGTVGETDQATLAGTNAAHAGGSVTYALYASSNCATSSAVARSTVAVGGGSVPASTAVTATLAPGRYYWVVTYSGDSANGPSGSACGSEVLTVTPPDAIAPQATSDGKTLTVGVSCVEVPCEVNASATAPTASAKPSAAQARRKVKAVVLGKGKFKIKKKGTNKLTLKLSGPGRRYLAGKHKAKVSLSVTQKIGGHSVVTRRTVTVTVTHPKRRAPK
jgi:hypothetical protein